LEKSKSYEAHYAVFSNLVSSSLFGPNILLNTLFSNTLSLCSSLNVWDQVSHPYRTTDKIMVYHTHNPRKQKTTKQKSSFWNAACLSVHMYVHMCPSLVPGCLNRFYSFLVFKSLSNTDQYLPNMNILASKMKALQISPHPKHDFLKNCWQLQLNFSNLWRFVIII
jgi:hypothetical protein